MTKVTRPFTSAGRRPASSRAARTASAASLSSLRPEFLENSVAPMPAIAAPVMPGSPGVLGGPPGWQGTSTRTVLVTWLPRLQLADDRDLVAVGLVVRRVLGDLAGEGQRVAGVARGAEPDLDRAEDRLVAGPGRDEALDQAGGGKDVHEDVFAAAGDGEVTVVVDLGEVTGRERGGDDERRRHVDGQPRQFDRSGARRGGWPPGRQHQLVIDLEETHLDRHPDLDLVRVDAGQLGEYPDAFGEFHEGDYQRKLLAGDGRVVMHHVAEHLAGASRDDVLRVR